MSTKFKASLDKSGTKYNLVVSQNGIDLVNRLISAPQGQEQLNAYISFIKYLNKSVNDYIHEQPDFMFKNINELRKYAGGNLQNKWLIEYEKEKETIIKDSHK